MAFEERELAHRSRHRKPGPAELNRKSSTSIRTNQLAENQEPERAA
ncbi:hypothetical protein FRUB_06896 [Fimbriiglobus ruber]|uniref:Mobile element protein n=1 Tax=Fimbriiglobus ruber TaxID=1908690 RepID=A0A225DK06_9BACT|nr:hypothetical protein FRUB_06896 [Fimbriiglobus ruber]